MATGTIGPLRSSIDGGVTWKSVGGESAVKAKYLAPDPVSSDKRVWALDLTRLKPPAIHEIRRNGDSIEAVTRTTLTFPDSLVTARSVSATSPTQRRFWIGTWGQGVCTSDDSGATWTQRNAGLPDLKVYVPGIRDIGDALVMTDQGLHTYPAAPTVSIAKDNSGQHSKPVESGKGSSRPHLGITGRTEGFLFRADGRLIQEQRIRR